MCWPTMLYLNRICVYIYNLCDSLIFSLILNIIQDLMDNHNLLKQMVTKINIRILRFQSDQCFSTILPPLNADMCTLRSRHCLESTFTFSEAETWLCYAFCQAESQDKPEQGETPELFFSLLILSYKKLCSMVKS